MEASDAAVTKPFRLKKENEQNGQRVLKDMRTVSFFARKDADLL